MLNLICVFFYLLLNEFKKTDKMMPKRELENKIMWWLGDLSFLSFKLINLI